MGGHPDRIREVLAISGTAGADASKDSQRGERDRGLHRQAPVTDDSPAGNRAVLMAEGVREAIRVGGRILYRKEFQRLETDPAKPALANR